MYDCTDCIGYIIFKIRQLSNKKELKQFSLDLIASKLSKENTTKILPYWTFQKALIERLLPGEESFNLELKDNRERMENYKDLTTLIKTAPSMETIKSIVDMISFYDLKDSPVTKKEVTLLINTRIKEIKGKWY